MEFKNDYSPKGLELYLFQLTIQLILTNQKCIKCSFGVIRPWIQTTWVI